MLTLLAIAFPSYVITPYLAKRLSSYGGERERLFTQYVTIFVLALLVFAFVPARPSSSSRLLWITLLGIGNGVAYFFYWRAVEISLSVTSAFNWIGNVIAILLATIFLGEGQSLTPTHLIAIALCISAAAMYSRGSEVPRGRLTNQRSIVAPIFAFNLIWGLIEFAMRPLAVSELSPALFGLGFYGGSASAAAVLLLFHSGKKDFSLLKSAKPALILLAVSIYWATVGYFWMLRDTPLTLAVPALQGCSVLLPTLVGALCFGELRTMPRRQRIAVGISILGAGLLFFGSRLSPEESKGAVNQESPPPTAGQQGAGT